MVILIAIKKIPPKTDHTLSQVGAMRRRCWMICRRMGRGQTPEQGPSITLQRDAHTWSHEKSAASPVSALLVLVLQFLV